MINIRLQISGDSQGPYLYHQEGYLSQLAQKNCIHFPVRQRMDHIRVPGLAVPHIAAAH
jgi:hypothetical protein